MIQSMTGYAAASADAPGGRISVELRSVNSRFLDLQSRVAEELRALEPALRELIVSRLSRGKVDCRLYLNAPEGSEQQGELSAPAMARLKALADEAAKAFPSAAPLRIADVLRWPGVIAQPQADEQAMRAIAHKLCSTALDELVAARAREGEKLAAVIRSRIAEMRRRVQEVSPLIPESVAAYQARLTEK